MNERGRTTVSYCALLKVLRLIKRIRKIEVSLGRLQFLLKKGGRNRNVPEPGLAGKDQ